MSLENENDTATTHPTQSGISIKRALVGIHENDTQEDVEYCAKRLLACKLWENDSGAPWRHGAKTRDLEILCVSQFTLYGKLTKKHQPDYKHSMKAVPAKEMYETFLDTLKTNYNPEKIKDGVFGAMMDVGKDASLCWFGILHWVLLLQEETIVDFQSKMCF